MTVQNISKADLIRLVLPQVHDRVANGTFCEEELYVALCTIARLDTFQAVTDAPGLFNPGVISTLSINHG